MARETEANDPVNILTDFITQSAGAIVIMQAANDGGRYPELPLPNRELQGHFDVGDQELWVNIAGFRRFCQRRNMDYHKTRSTLSERGIIAATDRKKVIGQGTPKALARTNCMIVHMDHADLKDVDVRQPPAKAAPGQSHLPPNVVPFQKNGVAK